MTRGDLAFLWTSHQNVLRAAALRLGPGRLAGAGQRRWRRAVCELPRFTVQSERRRAGFTRPETDPAPLASSPASQVRAAGAGDTLLSAPQGPGRGVRAACVRVGPPLQPPLHLPHSFGQTLARPLTGCVTSGVTTVDTQVTPLRDRGKCMSSRAAVGSKVHLSGHGPSAGCSTEGCHGHPRLGLGLLCGLAL